MKDISIVGAGGHTRSLISLLENNGFSAAKIYDETWSPGREEFIRGVPVAGAIADIPAGEQLALSYGDNQKRAGLFEKFGDKLMAGPLIHSSAFVDEKASVGRYSQVFAGVFLNTCSIIGENCIINSRAIIEHESRVGRHCHISVGSIVCGRVEIGDFCFICAGAVIIDKTSICSGVTVGANSTVIRDITEPGVYAGSPAVRIR